MKKIEFSIAARKQQGSVLLIVIMGIAVLMILLVMGVININTNQVTSSQGMAQDEYLESVRQNISFWYRKNTNSDFLYDNTKSVQGCENNGICDLSNNVFLLEGGIYPKYNIRFYVSNVFSTYMGDPVTGAIDPNSADYHSNVMFRKIYFVIADTDVSIDDAVKWNPAANGFFNWNGSNSGIDLTLSINSGFENLVRYGVVDGKTIQEQQIAETYKILGQLAHLHEVRYKAKYEADAFHDLGLNYYRAQDCDKPLLEELVCTENVPNGAAFNPRLPLVAIELLNYGYREINVDAPGGIYANFKQTLGDGFPFKDAWGNNLVTNNNPSGGASDAPPYSMIVGAITPWKTWLFMNAVQPVN